MSKMVIFLFHQDLLMVEMENKESRKKENVFLCNFVLWKLSKNDAFFRWIFNTSSIA